MTDFGDEIRNCAREAMAVVEVPVTFLSGTGTFSATTLRYTNTETETEVNASPLLDYDRHMIDGSTIRHHDTYVMYVPAATGAVVVPRPGMTMLEGWRSDTTASGNRWSVIHVKEHRPDNGVVAAYEIQLRS